jgi:hypothetical protein
MKFWSKKKYIRKRKAEVIVTEREKREKVQEKGVDMQKPKYCVSCPQDMLSTEEYAVL